MIRNYMLRLKVNKLNAILPKIIILRRKYKLNNIILI